MSCPRNGRSVRNAAHVRGAASSSKRAPKRSGPTVISMSVIVSNAPGKAHAVTGRSRGRRPPAASGGQAAGVVGPLIPRGRMASDPPSGVVPAVAARAASQPERSVLAPDVDPAASAAPAPNAPAPDLKRTGKAIAQPASRSASVTILTVLALLYTLYFARAFLVPIVFAV